nr:hypothetical protein [Trichoderma atroviride]
MIDQPDHILSTYDSHNATLFTRYNFLGRRLAHDPFPNRVVQKHLARHLPTVIPNIAEETRHVVSAMFGNDTENWKPFTLWTYGWNVRSIILVNGHQAADTLDDFLCNLKLPVISIYGTALGSNEKLLCALSDPAKPPFSSLLE